MVVIPKSVTPSRITENFKATEVKLDAEDMRRLRELESKNFRFVAVRYLCYYLRVLLVSVTLPPGQGDFFFSKPCNVSEDVWDESADEKFEVQLECKKAKTKD